MRQGGGFCCGNWRQEKSRGLCGAANVSRCRDGKCAWVLLACFCREKYTYFPTLMCIVRVLSVSAFSPFRPFSSCFLPFPPFFQKIFWNPSCNLLRRNPRRARRAFCFARVLRMESAPSLRKRRKNGFRRVQEEKIIICLTTGRLPPRT